MWNSFSVVHYEEELLDAVHSGCFFPPSFSCFYSSWQNKKIWKNRLLGARKLFSSLRFFVVHTRHRQPPCVSLSVHLFSSFYSPSSLTPSLFVTPSASVFVSKVTALIIDAVWFRLCLLTVKRKKKKERKSWFLISTAVTTHVWLSYCFHGFKDMMYMMYNALVMGPWSLDQAQHQFIQLYVVFFFFSTTSYSH